MLGKGRKGRKGHAERRDWEGNGRVAFSPVPFLCHVGATSREREGSACCLLVRSLMTALNPRLALAFIIFADETRSGAGAGRGCVRARSPRTDPRAAPGPCLGLSRGTHLPASCKLFFFLRVLLSIFIIPRRVGHGQGWEPDRESLTCGVLLATLARIRCGSDGGPCMCGGSPRYDAADRVWKIMEWPSGNDRDGLLPFCSTWEVLPCSLGSKKKIYSIHHIKF